MRLHCVQCENRTNPSVQTFPPKEAHGKKEKKGGLVCRRLPQPLGKTSATVGTDWHHLPCSQRQRERPDSPAPPKQELLSAYRNEHGLSTSARSTRFCFATNLYYPPAVYNQTLI